MSHLTFCGAADSHRSRHLVAFGGKQVLLDCGEFQA